MTSNLLLSGTLVSVVIAVVRATAANGANAAASVAVVDTVVAIVLAIYISTAASRVLLFCLCRQAQSASLRWLILCSFPAASNAHSSDGTTAVVHNGVSRRERLAARGRGCTSSGSAAHIFK